MRIYQAIFIGDTIGFYVSEEKAKQAILEKIYTQYCHDLDLYRSIYKEFIDEDCVDELDIWIIPQYLNTEIE